MSLSRRIILSAAIVLVIFIILVTAALDRAFIDSTESALHDTLTSQLYALMASAEIEGNDLMMPLDELDAVLGLPSSGLYAQIVNKTGEILWQSSSVLGATPPEPVSLASGEKKFKKVSRNHGDYFTLAHGVNWIAGPTGIGLTFNIATDTTSFNKQIHRFRTTLWGWLIAMAALLLTSQAIILRWGLSPLRAVGKELVQIENGEQEKIEEIYPQEIDNLTKNINLLLEQERNQKTRYRNALGDLAHSLKTPLAVLQVGLQGQQDDSLQQQITQMNSIVDYQLQRASTAGSASIGNSVPIKLTVNRIIDSLQKVYADKKIQTNIQINNELVFKGDEGDLMELLGNLLDNAFKWSKQQVEISAEQSGNKLSIRIADDGPGFKPGHADKLLARGARADQSVAGHGIGLSIVMNIVQAYSGSLRIEQAAETGAEIWLSL